MKLALFTDPHYCDKEVTCRTRRPVLSYGKIREAMETFVREDVDFVLCLGDIIDKCDDPQKNIEKTREIAELSEYATHPPRRCMLSSMLFGSLPSSERTVLSLRIVPREGFVSYHRSTSWALPWANV